MKKIFGIVLALSFIAACAAPPTNNEVVTTNRNSAAETAPPAITEADAIAKEKGIWEAIRAKDYESFSNMLASDQIEVLDDGVHDKAASVEGVKQFEPSEVTFSDWKFLSIDRDAFIVAYTVAVKGKYQGKEFPTSSVRGSSVWAYRDKKWVAVFHQECEVKPAPAAAPTRDATPATSPSATPAAAPAPPGPDPIANEKAVWDLFKSKNYEAFGLMLAPDFIEIEPQGFYDKAGSIKGVSMFDASRVELSDWKSAKIDDDAMIVTYTLKGPPFGSAGERHSSIWARRDGKWLAVLHHGGTVVRKPTAPPPSPAASPAAAVSPATKAPAKTP
ncbi:MAG TPA: nuclear transport factor 2 family protein [Pyrinomonadaceae bacterium]|nr:nuclear transport factor 2 family protein [Pyrinomonadaceae bacterium]